MNSVQHTSMIGIDGGGTNCRFAMLHQGRRVDLQMGGANVSSDRSGALATLKGGLSQLADAAGLDLPDLAQFPAYVGLAGMVDQNTASSLAKDLPLTNVVIEDDRRTAMVGALGASDGCVMGIGTGSFLGRRVDGADRLIGGWGLVLGDDASGAYLGRQLLRRVLQVCDGVRDASPLTRDILYQFGAPGAIVHFASTAKPGEFAAYAPGIVAAARSGDAIGLGLMQDGAQYIERMLGHLGRQSGERLCPLGGLAPHYAPFLSPDVAAGLSAPDGTALDGALFLAAQMAPVGETA